MWTLYVPEFRISLLLVSCFDKAGLYTSFGKGKCSILQDTRVTVTGGRRPQHASPGNGKELKASTKKQLNFKL